MSTECVCGKRASKRRSVSPTGQRKMDIAWSIRVDECECGRRYAVSPEVLNKLQRDWLRRWNKHYDDLDSAENRCEQK